MYFPMGAWRRNLKFPNWRFLSADHNFNSASVELLRSFLAEDLDEIIISPSPRLRLASPSRGEELLKHGSYRFNGQFGVQLLANLGLDIFQGAAGGGGTTAAAAP